VAVSIKSFVLCDDVRKEITQKDILIGVYSSGIMVPFMPAQMQLAFWAEMLPTQIGQSEFQMRFDPPGGEAPIVMKFMMEITAVEYSTLAMSGIIIPFTKEGDLVVSISIDGADWVEVTRKRASSELPPPP
jgi:hypothetical protein